MRLLAIFAATAAVVVAASLESSAFDNFSCPTFTEGFCCKAEGKGMTMYDADEMCRKSVISEEEDGSSKKVPWVGCSAGEFSMCRVTDDPPVVVHHSSSSALSTEVPFSTEASSSTKTLSSADISSSTGILFSTQAPFSTEVLSSTEPPSTEFVFAAETDLSTEAPSSTQAPFLNKTISEVASALETHTRQCNISSVDGVF